MALWKKIHTITNAVWLFFVIATVGCAKPHTPVSKGTSGWISDRAIEIDLTLQGQAEVNCYDGRSATMDRRAENDPSGELDETSTIAITSTVRYGPDMARRKQPLSEQLRQAIENSGLTHYRISKDTGIDPAVISRFM